MFDLNNAVSKVKNATGLKTLETDDPTIEFATKPEFYGAIPEPTPANKAMPDWYKSLSQYTDGGNERNELGAATVKRCAPFMEAMTLGWIIPLVGKAEITAKDGSVESSWDFPESLLSPHGMGQVGGENFPASDWPILKWNNFWTMKLPEGYSALITSPMNRIEPRWQVFSGVVDLDNYYNFVNAPFMWTGGEYDGIIDEGTPLVQVIPFKRDSIISDATVNEMTEEEQQERARTEVELLSNESMYREERWTSKKGSRNVPAETKKEDKDESGSSCPFHL